MKIKKSMIAAAAVALMGTSAAGSAFAAENVQKPQGRFDNLIEAIAERFDLNVEDVQAVFEEQRPEINAGGQAHLEERIAKAVEDGVLTQTQADAILAHHEEMQEFIQSLEGMTQEERREALKEQHEANKAWAEENNIPAQFLPHEGRHEHGPNGPKGPRHNENTSENGE